MKRKSVDIPNPIVDVKEEHLFLSLTDEYNKMIEPTKISKIISSIRKRIPSPLEEKALSLKDTVSENDIFIKALEILGKNFQTLEQYSSKVTPTEKQIVSKLNEGSSELKITSLEEICLLRGYDISEVVNKNIITDIVAAFAEGAATGASGFAGMPFNLLLSTFLYYRAIQTIALFYGYDIKNDPTELEIVSGVFMNAVSPQSSNNNELSDSIAKIMLLTTKTSVKQTVKKGWSAMPENGGVYLLLTRMKALANNSAKKNLENVSGKSLENAAFKEFFEQIGRKLSQKALSNTIPLVGATIGATIDMTQMIKIVKYAGIFYGKRFILEKESKINMLVNKTRIVFKSRNYDGIEQFIIKNAIMNEITHSPRFIVFGEVTESIIVESENNCSLL